MSNNAKLNLGRTLGSIGNNGIQILTDCESYGMINGCDEECPVLNDAKCEIYSCVEEYLEDEDK